MAQIRITRGGCGIEYTDANGNARYVLKTPENGPFECDDTQAARLVKMGVAAYVAPKTEAPVAALDGQQEEPITAQFLNAEDLEKWDYNDIIALANDMGVVPESKKKADYIAAIVAVEVTPGEELDGEEDPDNELPELTAADPE